MIAICRLSKSRRKSKRCRPGTIEWTHVEIGVPTSAIPARIWFGTSTLRTGRRFSATLTLISADLGNVPGGRLRLTSTRPMRILGETGGPTGKTILDTSTHLIQKLVKISSGTDWSGKNSTAILISKRIYTTTSGIRAMYFL